MLSRLNPPTLKLMPAEDLLLKFPPLSVNPCKSNVPNGFFVFTLASFRFNVRFWRNRLPPGDEEKIREGEKFQFIFRFVKLNENCFLMLPLRHKPQLSTQLSLLWCLKHKQTQMRSFEFLMLKLFFYLLASKDDFFPLACLFIISYNIRPAYLSLRIKQNFNIFLATNKPPNVCR